MEEHYREIHREFRQQCDALEARGKKRFKGEAYENTAVVFAVSVPTVKRAVHFVESVEEPEMAAS